jgi:hypothetical protein
MNGLNPEKLKKKIVEAILDLTANPTVLHSIWRELAVLTSW